MAQLGLFGSGQLTLLDDETGKITYRPEAVDAAIASAWLIALRSEVEWHSTRRQMYEREVDVPRLTSSFLIGDPDAPAPVAHAGRIANELTGVRFTSAGLNLYRDGRDSVAPHNDHLYEIAEGYPIVLLSLGATRRMTIRSKAKPRRMFDLDLEHGSALVMSYETQKNYDHGVPKVREPVGVRISLALRVRPGA